MTAMLIGYFDSIIVKSCERLKAVIDDLCQAYKESILVYEEAIPTFKDFDDFRSAMVKLANVEDLLPMLPKQ